MACKNATTMTFRLYECRYPFTPEKPTYESFNLHDPQFHFDTGKVFSISAEITNESIARVMLKKIYGFDGSFANQWRVSDWAKEFQEGTIYGVWYIKRVV